MSDLGFYKKEHFTAVRDPIQGLLVQPVAVNQTDE